MSAVWPPLLSLVCLVLSGLGVHCQTGRPEQCKKPSIGNLEKLSADKEYYNWGEEVALHCKSGYYPSLDKIRCMRLGGRSDWRPAAVCIEVRVTNMNVTSTGICLTIVCTPDQCQNTRTSYISSCIMQKDFYTECKYGSGEKIFWNLAPSTQYDLVLSHGSDQSSVTLETLYITTAKTDLTVRNSTESSIMSSDVIHGVIIPIFSVKLLILVVLIIIQYIVADRDSSETDLDKKEESKGNSILYRTRGADYVNADEAADPGVCEDPRDVAQS